MKRGIRLEVGWGGVRVTMEVQGTTSRVKEVKCPKHPWWVQSGDNNTAANSTACKLSWVFIGIRATLNTHQVFYITLVLVKDNYREYWEHKFFSYQWSRFFSFTWSCKKRCKRLIPSGIWHTELPALKWGLLKILCHMWICDSIILYVSNLSILWKLGFGKSQNWDEVLPAQNFQAPP